MKISKAFKIRLLMYGAILLLSLTVVFGIGWRLEWDIHSGMERRLTTIWGVPVQHGEPTSTLLAEWRAADAGERVWVTVAEGPRSAIFSHCSSQLLYDLEWLGQKIATPGWRREYARWLLRELDETRKVCRVSHHNRRVGYALYDNADISTLERLRQIWRHTEHAGAASAGRAR